MIRIATSIVGKLWGTILLLVSFVLFIFTVFMLEFLENYHREQAEASLNQSANAIASIVEKYSDSESPIEVIKDVLGDHTNALVAENRFEVVYAIQDGINQEEIRQEILQNSKFSAIYESTEPILQEMILPSQEEKDKMENYVVLAFPLKSEESLHGAVFI
ncbi:MAG: histidine kinase, partial [Lysinibacillus sp.]